MSCKKCGHKLILGRAFVDYINPDPEPYESDHEVEIDDIAFNDSLNVHYCEGCDIIHDIWDDNGKHIVEQPAPPKETKTNDGKGGGICLRNM